MVVAADVSLVEAGTLINDVTGIFDAAVDEDCALADDIKATTDTITEVCREKRDEIKEIIKEYTQRVEAAKSEASYDAGSHPRALEEIESAKRGVIENIRSMEEEHAATVDAKTDAEGKRVEAELAHRQLQGAQAIDIPETETLLNLYKHVTGVQWDYEAKSVKGYVSQPQYNRVRAFDVTKDVGAVETADELWAMIAA